MLIFEPMTQRSNPLPNASHPPHAAAVMLRAALTSPTAILASAALILVLVLITGPTSAEYGFA